MYYPPFLWEKKMKMDSQPPQSGSYKKNGVMYLKYFWLLLVLDKKQLPIASRRSTEPSTAATVQLAVVQ